MGGAIPITAGIASPKQFFRYGESCHWFKHTFQPGEEMASKQWDYVSPIPCALEVVALSWQIFAKSAEDLDRALWEGVLEWVFPSVKIPIGPLTQATGSLGDHFFPENRGAMERLAETGSNLPSEEMWRILTQGNRVGDTYTFNGRMQYAKHSVLIPAGAHCSLLMYAENEVQFVNEFRIRVILHGVFKNIIEVG